MTKEQLKKYVPLKREVERLRKQIKELEEDKQSIQSQQIDGMPHAHGGSDSRIDALMDKYDKLLNIYYAKTAECLETLAVIEAAIDSLSDPIDRDLMYAKYIKGYRWEKVCTIIGYSWRQTHRRHSRILQQLAKAEGQR